MATTQKFSPEAYKQPAGNITVLKKMGASIVASVADALPGFMRKQAPAMLRALYTECQKSPALLKCSPQSLFGAVIQAAQMGLQIGGALGQCYLVPFKGSVTLIPGYKGYIQLVNRSGQVGIINAFVVYNKDQFDVTMGTAPTITHIPGSYPTAADVRSRKPVAYYATCHTKTGPRFVVLTQAEAEVHRDRFALSQNGPWRDHFEAMSLKTCIIKLCKYLPMSAELQTATALDEQLEAGDGVDCSYLFQVEGDEDEELAEPKDKIDALRQKLAPRQTEAEAPAHKANASPLIELLDQYIAAGGDSGALLTKLDATPEDLENAMGGRADKYKAAIRKAMSELPRP